MFFDRLVSKTGKILTGYEISGKGDGIAKMREELKEQMETLREIRKNAGLNRREFSDYMGIPLRTIEEWEGGRRKMPDYLLRLIAYKFKVESFLKDKGMTLE